MLYVSGKVTKGYEVTDTKSGRIMTYSLEQLISLSKDMYIAGIRDEKVERVYTFDEYAENVVYTRQRALGTDFPRSMKVVWRNDSFNGNVLMECADNSAYIVLPEGVHTISSNLFNGRTNLERVYLPRRLQQVCEWAFSGTGLTEVKFSEAILAIDTGAFSGCLQLSVVKFPNKVEQFFEIRPFAFANTTVESIVMPEHCNTFEIDFSAFHNCTNLRRVVMPRGDEGFSLLRPAHPFSGCTNLRYVFIPECSFSLLEDAKSFWNRFHVNSHSAYEGDILSKRVGGVPAGARLSFEEYVVGAKQRPTYVILPKYEQYIERLRGISELRFEILPSTVRYKGELVSTDTLYYEAVEKGVYKDNRLTVDEFLQLFGL